jgi:hypothetical protein
MVEQSSMLAGATAGFVSRVICHPIDTIKAKMQVRVRLTEIKTPKGDEPCWTRGVCRHQPRGFSENLFYAYSEGSA